MKYWMRDYLIPGILSILFLTSMIMYRPGEIPPLWFDEGWTLTVARNWVETGQYARLLAGNPVSALLMSKSLSITAPIFLIFKIFGIGIVQGRLFPMLSISLAIYCIFRLAFRLFQTRSAYLSIFVLIFLAVPIHPWIIGKEAIAESPMVLYLSVGYLFLISYLDGKKGALIGAVLFGGLALDSKAHVIPFWSVAILFPILIAYKRKHWSICKRLLIVWVGSLLIYLLLYGIQNILYNGYPQHDGPVSGFFTLNIIVLNTAVRVFTLQNTLIFGIPSLVGILSFIRCSGNQRFFQNESSDQYARFSLLVLVCAWFVWFSMFSTGWPRYFFPIFFFSSLFISRWLDDLLISFKRLFVGDFKQYVWARGKIYLSLLLLVYTISLNFASLRQQVLQGNNHAVETAQYIENSIPENVLIETYESELLFLLDHPIHYPPDQVQFDFNRRQYLNENLDRIYLPLNVEFKYLVDGPISKMWSLYSPLLEAENFKNIATFGKYDIYERLP